MFPLAFYQPMICLVRLSASWCHFWHCPLEIDFTWAERGGTGGSGWVHPKDANSMAVSTLGWSWVSHFCYSELVLAKHPDQLLSNEWVGLESQMYLGWLNAVLCAAWDGNPWSRVCLNREWLLVGVVIMNAPLMSTNETSESCLCSSNDSAALWEHR